LECNDDREAVARATGLSRGRISMPDLPIETVSTGIPFTVTPAEILLSGIQKLKVDLTALPNIWRKTGGKFLYYRGP